MNSDFSLLKPLLMEKLKSIPNNLKNQTEKFVEDLLSRAKKEKNLDPSSLSSQIESIRREGENVTTSIRLSFFYADFDAVLRLVSNSSKVLVIVYKVYTVC